MKKVLIIFSVLLFTTNAYSQKIFGYFENCYLTSASDNKFSSQDAILKEMITDEFDTKNYEELYFVVLTDYIRKKFVMTDFGLQEGERKFKKRFPKLEYKPQRILQSSWKIKETSKNYIVAESISSLEGNITLNFKNGEVNQVTGSTNLTYQCEIRDKSNGKKSNYLDYWWAVILIIAITFFIFTQSGKRLKKIRRK